MIAICLQLVVMVLFQHAQRTAIHVPIMVYRQCAELVVAIWALLRTLAQPDWNVLVGEPYDFADFLPCKFEVL